MTMNSQIKCGTEGRRLAVRDHDILNGIDYLEVNTSKSAVSDHQYRALLFVHCFKPISAIDKKNVFFVGGVRIKNIETVWAASANQIKKALSNSETEITKDLSDDEKEIIETIEPANLFIWDSIPGSDSNKLKNFLRNNFGLKWLVDEENNLEFVKSNDNQTITISSSAPNDGTHTASIRLDSEPDNAKAATLAVDNDDVEKFEFGAKIDDNNKLLIYDIPLLVIRPSTIGDFSIYTLRLIKPRTPELPPANFDSQLSQINFSFKVECPSEFDCLEERRCPPELLQEPIIDYMARDFASFRRLMLDRMAVIMPGWNERRNTADMSVMLVELLAYAGDHLSYYQDAIATKAYLGTALDRVSIKRHARLLDYHMHDGCNARALIRMEVGGLPDGFGLMVPKQTTLLTGSKEEEDGAGNNQGNGKRVVVEEEDFEEELSKGAEAFETMHDIILYPAHNEISFYTWGDSRCCLPKGSTQATIKNENNKLDLLFIWDSIPGSDSNKLKNFLRNNFGLKWLVDEENNLEFVKSNDNQTIMISSSAPNDGTHTASIRLDSEPDNAKAATLAVDNDDVEKFEFGAKIMEGSLTLCATSLKVGDIIIFEEIRSPTNGKVADADPSHCHAVRLVQIRPKIDDLNGTPIIDIRWTHEDALPFPLCLWEVLDEEQKPQPVSIARGNVVLADHGYTVDKEALKDSGAKTKYRPYLARKPLTHVLPFDISTKSISSAFFNHGVAEAIPVVSLNGEGRVWSPRHDLLTSDKFAAEFVVEIEEDGTAYLRFGDGQQGKKATSSSSDNSFSATYRVGNGQQGNVGAKTINRIVVKSKGFNPKGIITKITNPMEARGGTDPENMEDVRLYAPAAFRRRQERAVTEADYVEVLKRHPMVQKAAVSLQWTGSWYTINVTIDRIGGLPVNNEFKEEIRKFLDIYRMASQDIEVLEAVHIPLEIIISVCVAPNYFRGKVKQALLEAFSNGDLSDKRRGFFHPDNFTFGQSVYLSKIYEVAMKVEGVSSVIVRRFQRWGKPSHGELDNGLIKIESSEIAILDNDPNLPENGTIQFIMEGGL